MIKNIFKPLNKNLKLLLPIEVKNVSLKLNDSFFFKKISLKIDTKLISCFIGPNGAGKTSCIKLLIGLTKPNSGEILFSKSNKIPNAIGYVPQKIILLRRTVEENLLHALALSNYMSNKRKERVKEILKFSNLEHLSKKSARKLSLGQQQLLSVLRSLISRPSFLILDEPCANLDLQTTKIIENILKVASQNGVKIIIVTHDLFQAKRLADEIIFFYNGKIIEQNKSNIFFKKPKSREAKNFQKGLLLK